MAGVDSASAGLPGDGWTAGTRATLRGGAAMEVAGMGKREPRRETERDELAEEIVNLGGEVFGPSLELEDDESHDDEEAVGPDAESVSFASLAIKTTPDGRIVFDHTSIREHVHLAVVCVFAFLGFLFAFYVEPDSTSREQSLEQLTGGASATTLAWLCFGVAIGAGVLLTRIDDHCAYEPASGCFLAVRKLGGMRSERLLCLRSDVVQVALDAGVRFDSRSQWWVYGVALVLADGRCLRLAGTAADDSGHACARRAVEWLGKTLGVPARVGPKCVYLKVVRGASGGFEASYRPSDWTLWLWHPLGIAVILLLGVALMVATSGR